MEFEICLQDIWRHFLSRTHFWVRIDSDPTTFTLIYWNRCWRNDTHWFDFFSCIDRPTISSDTSYCHNIAQLLHTRNHRAIAFSMLKLWMRALYEPKVACPLADIITNKIFYPKLWTISDIVQTKKNVIVDNVSTTVSCKPSNAWLTNWQYSLTLIV